MRENRRQDVGGSSDRETDVNIYRSGSAPPTVEGSLNAVAGLFNGGRNGLSAEFNGISEEELRSDPAYLSYYYANVNLNPRLPPPLMSKEDWRFSQRLQGGLGSGSSAIGDRRKLNKADNPGLTDSRKLQGGGSGAEWGGNGLIGLPGLGLGSSQKSIAEIIQDDISGSRNPSRYTFDGNTDLSESHLPHLHKNLASMSLSDQQGLPAKSYINGPKNGTRGSTSPQYQNLNSPTSSFYGGGYIMNPTSPTMVSGQNFPPLFDNAAIAAAMGGGFGLGPIRNQSPSPLQMPLMDPLYLQNLRSSEYTDRELLALQKAYLAGLLSSQKSQYSLNHGYYGNSAYGLGMSHPGSPLLPGSPVNADRGLRFPSGIRVVGGEGFASSLLDEFKNNKVKSFELSEISGHVVEFSADQYGSRFIQQKLETAAKEEKEMVFHEIMPQALSLMTDVFGNYVIQKFFEHGNAGQIRELAVELTGHVLTLSLQMYGCRVIQKAIEVVDFDQQVKMVGELDGHVMRCVRDQNGNHVVQKCIECVPEDAIRFIISTFYDQVVTLSMHPYGCRVIQRVLEHCVDPKTQNIVMDEILNSICMLAQDQYGNYVVQHVLEHGKPHERTYIINQLTGQIVQMSQQKFASNVVEKCLTFGTPEQRQILVTEMLGTTDENEPLQVMMKDQFANYVVQKVLETCDDRQLELILNRIKVHLNALKKYTYGKHIVARVEKLVAAGERRIGTLAGYAAAAAAAAAMT
ncbi:hypothetical protein L1887_16590 [Cichorium endivia]|nr:hypothetical protein L1887_16590 [Cichorium endivia]